MEQTNIVYDSVTAGAIRMARRRWYLLALATAAGLVAGFLASSMGPAYTASTNVQLRLAVVATPASNTSDDPRVDPVSLANRIDVTDTDSDSALPPSATATVTGDDKAGVIKITVSADSEADATAGLDTLVERTKAAALEEVSGPLNVRISALENLMTENRVRVADIDAQLDELLSSGGSPSASSPLILARVDAANAANTAEMNLQLAKKRLETMTSSLTSVTKTKVTPAERSLMMPVALGVLALAAAFGVCLVLQATDGRIRRRIQIERDVPHASVLAVLSTQPAKAQVDALGRSLSRFVDSAGTTQVALVDLRPRASGDLGDLIGKQLPAKVTTIDIANAPDYFGDESTTVLLAVPFGGVRQESLQAAVANARTAGSEHIAAIITNVPGADHAWSSVSIY